MEGLGPIRFRITFSLVSWSPSRLVGSLVFCASGRFPLALSRMYPANISRIAADVIISLAGAKLGNTLFSEKRRSLFGVSEFPQFK